MGKLASGSEGESKDRRLLEARLQSAREMLEMQRQVQALELGGGTEGEEGREEINDSGRDKDNNEGGHGGGKAAKEGERRKDKSVEELQKEANERDMDPEAKRSLERASEQMASGDAAKAQASLRHCLRIEPLCYQASLQVSHLPLSFTFGE